MYEHIPRFSIADDRELWDFDIVGKLFDRKQLFGTRRFFVESK
jgi:hypothetical protein